MLELQVALGAIEHIKRAQPERILINLGVSEETLNLVTGNQPWTVQDRHEVMRCIDALNHGVCDIVGIPRVALPIEYVGASIAKFVHPVNTQTACQWSEIGPGVKEMAGGNSKSIISEPMTSDRLFSLVLMLQDNLKNNYQSSQFKLAVEKCIKDYDANQEETNAKKTK